MLQEIRTHFSVLNVGLRRLSSIPAPYEAFTYFDGYSYGVAVEYGKTEPLSQRFANAQLCTKTLDVSGTPKTYIILRSFKKSLYYEFATICAQFVDPGKNGKDRKALLDNPSQWWMNWRDLLGNSITDRYCYSVIAEMTALDYLLSKGKKVEWHAAISGSHDIECDNESFEVKSTLKRYGASITISGQHQLKSSKPLSLMFCRMEKSSTGTSINDMIVNLVSHGYDSSVLESELASMGYELGAMERTQKYRILEKRLYTVDSNFPKIVDSSFIGGHVPQGVLQITYTVDLDALPYTTW